ncbi:MAG: TVP38/TMEM64 family protein [Verrucomicrobiae bacterium]|nr:TVP38/TMEM64 family protein [Verrucomicrobiae bacterium]
MEPPEPGQHPTGDRPEPPEGTRPREASEWDTLVAFFRRLGPAAWLGLAWGALPPLGGFLVLFNLGPISEVLRGEAEAGTVRLALGMAVYIAFFMVSAGCGFLPTYSQAILAGYAFGVPAGFGAAWVGFGGASMVGFLISGRLARARIEREIQREARVRAIRDALVGSGFGRALLIVTLVRVPPNSPFALMNLALCASGVARHTYLLGTLLGMAPRTFAAVLVGSQIVDWSDVGKPRWMIVGGIILTITALGLIGTMANRALKRVTGP